MFFVFQIQLQRDLDHERDEVKKLEAKLEDVINSLPYQNQGTSLKTGTSILFQLSFLWMAFMYWL